MISLRRAASDAEVLDRDYRLEPEIEEHGLTLKIQRRGDTGAEKSVVGAVKKLRSGDVVVRFGSTSYLYTIEAMVKDATARHMRKKREAEGGRPS